MLNIQTINPLFISSHKGNVSTLTSCRQRPLAFARLCCCLAIVTLTLQTLTTGIFPFWCSGRPGRVEVHTTMTCGKSNLEKNMKRKTTHTCVCVEMQAMPKRFYDVRHRNVGTALQGEHGQGVGIPSTTTGISSTEDIFVIICLNTFSSTVGLITEGEPDGKSLSEGKSVRGSY